MSKMIKQLIPQPPVDPQDVVRWADSITEILNNILEREEKTAIALTDHGSLAGLTEDDHTMYLKEKGSGSAGEIPIHTHVSDAQAGTIDHGALTGRGDDDHTKYLLDKASGGAAGEIPVHTHASAAQAGQVDHGALTGLGDDDHSAYMLDCGTPADNTLIRANGTDGRTTQTSGVIVDDSDNITTTGYLQAAYVNITNESNGYRIDGTTVLTFDANNNLRVGPGIGTSFTTASNNTLIGNGAGGLLTDESGYICIGPSAGSKAESLADNYLFIDNVNRVNEPGMLAEAIIVGLMEPGGGTPENQWLTFNVGSHQVGSSNAANFLFTVATDLILSFRSNNTGVLTWMDDEDYFKFSDDIMLIGGENIILDTSTGTQIATTTSQLLGFFGATPVNQPVTVSDAATQDLTGGDTLDRTKTETDLTSCKNAINAIIDRLQELGLVA